MSPSYHDFAALLRRVAPVGGEPIDGLSAKDICACAAEEIEAQRDALRRLGEWVEANRVEVAGLHQEIVGLQRALARQSGNDPKSSTTGQANLVAKSGCRPPYLHR